MGGGRGGGGFGGGRGGGGRGGGFGGGGMRGGSAARAAVRASAARSFSSSARSSASFASGIGKAAGGSRIGGFGGSGIYPFVYIHPMTPLSYNNRNYYWSQSAYDSRHSAAGEEKDRCEFEVTKDENFKDFRYEDGQKPNKIIWECPKHQCDSEGLGCGPPNFGLTWPILISTIVVLLIPWEMIPMCLKGECCKKKPEEESPPSEPTVVYRASSSSAPIAKYSPASTFDAPPAYKKVQAL